MERKGGRQEPSEPNSTPEPSEDSPAPASRQEEFSEEERERLKALARSPSTEEVKGIPAPGKDPDLQRREDVGDIVLKRIYGSVLLMALLAQLGFANYMFFRYARDGVGWNIDPGVMKAWLAATVIEVIGITAIVVRHLFPRRGDPRRVTARSGIFRRRKKDQK